MKNKSDKYSNCVTPWGSFIYGIHKPSYKVTNLRSDEKIEPLGLFDDGSVNTNHTNFPMEDVVVNDGHWIFEIPNPFPFRGTTYIDKEWADASAADYSRIQLSKPEDLSFTQLLNRKEIPSNFISELPQALLLTLATCSTDPEDLIQIALMSCSFSKDSDGQVNGLKYQKQADGKVSVDIVNHPLFKAVSNNPNLPDNYKKAMVLRPGAQGASEIIGEWPVDDHTHVYEYLRKNSYIAGGHYAANMADDEVRYSINSMKPEDMSALRHLYYQRSYTRLAELLHLYDTTNKNIYSETELERLRQKLLEKISNEEIEEMATLWGWNFGFGYAPTNYRLHGSHQQIHQQYSMVQESVETYSGNLNTPVGKIRPFSSGDMVSTVISDYYHHFSSDFFSDYLAAIQNNKRMDERDDLASSLVVWRDDNVILFVPKAQTSQWELQLMTLEDQNGHYPGNIFETDLKCRKSIDEAMLKAQQGLEQLGAKMVTTIEYSKRISSKKKYNHPLLYSFLPKLPQSPGAFSEAQLRFINGHYPEDFAAVCRNCL